VSLGQYLVGLVFLVATVGPAGISAHLLVRKLARPSDVTTRVIACSVAFTAILIAVHLVPGALGILSRGWVVAASVLVLLVALACPDVSPAGTDLPAEPTPPEDRVSLVAAGLALFGLVTGAVAFLGEEGTSPITHSDTLDYHFAVVADWMLHHSTWGVTNFEPGLAAGNYPQNGDIVILASVLPWHDDAFARLAVLPYWALCGVVVFALARALGVRRSMAMLAAAAFMSVYTVMAPAVALAFPDVVAVAMLGAGVLFLMRDSKDGAWSDLALAGMALGISFGAKWYTSSAVVVVIALWLGCALLARRGVRNVFRRTALLSALTLAWGGFWLLRNLVRSGSPTFPRGLHVAGLTIFDVPHDYVAARFDHTVSEYVLQPHIWSAYLVPGYRAALGLAGPVVVVGIVLAVWALWRTVRQRRRTGEPQPFPPGVMPAAALLVGAIALAALYSKTPYSALGVSGKPLLVKQNARYLLPALVLAVPVTAWAFERLGKLRVAGAVALLAVTFDGVHRSVGAGHAALVLAALGVALVAAATVFAARRSRHSVVALGVVGAVGLAVLGFAMQRSFNRTRFDSKDPAFRWVSEHAPSGTKIGLVGTNSLEGTPAPYPMYGPRLENHVSYVGHYVKGGLRVYRSQRQLSGALRKGHYDLLVVGRADQLGEEGTHPARWARAAGFESLTHSAALTLMRAPGR
jgi:hypothetical protein